MKHATRGRASEVTITGLIRPVDWGHSRRLTEVAIRPLGRHSHVGEVLISRDGVGWELQAYINECVTVSGVMVRSEHGERSIYVTRYSSV